MKTLIVLACALSLFGCTNGKAPQNQPGNGNASAAPKEPKKNTKVTANEIIQMFKDNQLPIGRVLVFTDETDPNHLLNRPNQYTEKLDWEDKRVKQDDPKYPTGGTIEVFNSIEDLQKRKDYFEKGLPTVMSGANPEYTYIYKTALIRVRHYLTPAQAKDYEKVLTNQQ